MPNYIPIIDLEKTSEISEMAHRVQEPIFITKNGHIDLVVMSVELYDRICGVIKIDQAIAEAEKEMKLGGEAIEADKAFEKLDSKYYG